MHSLHRFLYVFFKMLRTVEAVRGMTRDLTATSWENLILASRLYGMTQQAVEKRAYELFEIQKRDYRTVPGYSCA